MPMFRKLLIANRGEIAVRVIRACRELGIRTVAVYSEADRHALHVRLADEAFCIGPPRPRNPTSTSQHHEHGRTPRRRRHPPRVRFSCGKPALLRNLPRREHHLRGPHPGGDRDHGQQSRGSPAHESGGVPVIPGSNGPVRNEAEAIEVSKTIGFPLIVKAAAGGGATACASCTRGRSAPGAPDRPSRGRGGVWSGEVYLEKYVEEPRHIEIQIMADGFKNTLYLGARDCSIQRRHQKLLEESPPRVCGSGTSGR